MAWTETHAIKLGWPFLSVLSYHCTGINESWGKTGNTKEPERERGRESEREMVGLVGGYFSKTKDKYEQKCSMSCVDKGERGGKELGGNISKNKLLVVFLFLSPH